MPEEIHVIKSSGDEAVFNEEKLRHSLKRSGAGSNDIERIIHEIESMLYEGITTQEIYKKAFSLLKRKSKSIAGRYKLKKAIFELGPTGFPFENFVSELLKHEGYKVKVGEIVPGICVNHEVDVVAIKENEIFMVECKFHGDQQRTCDVKIPLYIHSRFNDIRKHYEIVHEGMGFDKGWLVTNTRFTKDAIQYGECAGLRLLGWNYPKNEGLKEKIDKSGLYPITTLSTLTSTEKESLLKENIVLCSDIFHNHDLLKKAHISQKRYDRILGEIGGLLFSISSEK